jgi:TRAP-type C4-dicarboxylate transport system substrate-binding protein
MTAAWTVRRAGLAAGLCALLAGTGPAGAETFNLTAVAGHPPVFLWVKLLTEQFIPGVNKQLEDAGGQHKIDWTEAYGGTVAKLGSELEAVQEGIGDIGIVSTIFDAAKMPMQNVSYVTPFGSDDIGVVTGGVTRLQQDIPAMDAAWARHNLVFLGGVALDSYHLFTTFPVTSVEDLQGKKILAPGPSANWVQGTGAVAVAGSLPTYYNDIKTGVADGVLTFITGGWAAKVHEVAPHVTLMNFGSQFGGGVAINKDVWESLPPEVQAVFRDEADKYTVAFAEAQQAAAGALLQKMADAGAKVARPEPALRKAWAEKIPNVAKEWAAKLEAEGLPGKEVLKGYMAYIRSHGAEVPRDWSAE